jgi:hypothetical protein
VTRPDLVVVLAGVVVNAGTGPENAIRAATPVPVAVTDVLLPPLTTTPAAKVSGTLEAVAVVGLYVTVKVQAAAPAAMFAPQLPPVRVNGAAIVGRARATLPVLVIVKLSPPLVLPTATLPKASGLGVTVAAETAATPVPVTGTGALVTVTPLAVTVSEPDWAPRVLAVGANDTVIVQFAPAASVTPQVVVLPNGAARVPTAMPFAITVPLLRNVRVMFGVVTPTALLPKAAEVGVTVRIAVAAVPENSTAPISTAAPVFLLLPKKSYIGASA